MAAVVGFLVVGLRLFQAQALDGETWPRKLRRDALADVVVGQLNDFDARRQQRGDDVGLQEVDDGHAVVGGDEDFFCH